MLFKSEERLAHKAIRMSFRQGQPRKMEKLRDYNLKKVLRSKEGRPIHEEHKTEMRDEASEYQRLYGLAIEEGIEVSGPESLDFLHTRLAGCMVGRESDSAWLYLLTSTLK